MNLFQQHKAFEDLKIKVEAFFPHHIVRYKFITLTNVVHFKCYSRKPSLELVVRGFYHIIGNYGFIKDNEENINKIKFYDNRKSN